MIVRKKSVEKERRKLKLHLDKVKSEQDRVIEKVEGTLTDPS